MSENLEAKPFPEWLTKSFLESHLTEYYKKEIKVTTFDVNSGKDEGFTGSMLRTKVIFCVLGGDDAPNEDKVSFL